MKRETVKDYINSLEDTFADFKTFIHEKIIDAFDSWDSEITIDIECKLNMNTDDNTFNKHYQVKLFSCNENQFKETMVISGNIIIREGSHYFNLNLEGGLKGREYDKLRVNINNMKNRLAELLGLNPGSELPY